MNGSPAKLGTIQGTSGHKAALEEASPNKSNLLDITKTAGKVGDELKKGAELVKETTKKPKTNPTGAVSNKEAATLIKSGKTGTGIKTEKPKMAQQVRQEKRLDKITKRRKGKAEKKGKEYTTTTRQELLKKKIAMTTDERIRWNQQQTKQYIDLGLRATSIALGGGHGGGYSSGGADFSRTLPSEGETAQRSGLGTGFQTTKPITSPPTPGGSEIEVEDAGTGAHYTSGITPGSAKPKKKKVETKEPEELKGYDKYLYGE